MVVVYTCDELTPDLCELEKEQGQVEVNGINVTYFKYFQAVHDNNIPNDDAQQRRQKFPIVAIHGGPSFTHNYMLPLKQQACLGRTIIFYDQAGCGKSLPPGTDGTVKFNVSDFPWLLDPLYYSTVELPALIRHLGLRDFHIVANSWGTMLSQLYALDAAKEDETRKHLVSMVLSGPLSDSVSYIEAQWSQTDGSLGSLPPFIQKRIHSLEENKDYDSEEYQTLDSILTGFFTLRTQPSPDCWIDSENQQNAEIYTAMQGPSEFTMQGVLGNFNVTGRLKEIEVPVLLSHGKYDTMRPSIVETMRKTLPNAETLFLEKSGHASMIDEPGKMNDGIANFFDRVEAANINKSLHFGLATWSRPMSLLEQQRNPSQPLMGSSVHVSTVTLSTLMALMVGYAMGHYRANSHKRRSYYTAIYD